MVKLSNRQLWNGVVDESSNGGMVECWSCRIVKSLNGGVDESSNVVMVKLSNS